nr:hypothetical protein GCM10020185_47150 [Pseudomonas brassicacearum subsp. brassicacearum]
MIATDPSLPGSPDMAAYFLNADGSPKAAGTTLKNPALAGVLKRIAKEGPDALYKGPVAEEMVAKVRGHANPGSLSLNDLQGYAARERAPLCSDYKRWQVCGMAPLLLAGSPWRRSSGHCRPWNNATATMPSRR